MDIEVKRDGWGEAHPQDIRAVLLSVEAHLGTHFSPSFAESIRVIPSLQGMDYPMTFNRTSNDQAIIIQLTPRGRYWAQFSYQFAHELCHVYQGYERLHDNPSNWLHESICELASLFTLRSMAETWRDNPPYSSWAGYSETLENYAEERMQRPEHRLPTGTTIAQWLTSEEDSLREDHRQRDKNTVVAAILLPLFEKNPTGWNTVRALPDSLSPLKSYLSEWCRQVEPEERWFVEQLAERLEQ